MREMVQFVKNKSLSASFLLNFIRTILNFLFPTIMFAYGARILGADGVGIVSYTDSIVKYFMLLGGGGFSFYGMREIAKVRSNRAELEKTIRELLFINLLFTGCAYILFFIFIGLSDSRQYIAIFFIQGSLLLFQAVGMEWLYNGLEEQACLTKRTLLFQAVAVIAVFLFVRKKEDFIVYALLCVLAPAGTHIINFICANKYLKTGRTQVRRQIRKHFTSMKYIFAANLAISIYLHMDKTMIGAMIGTSEVGLYTAASHITRAAAGLLTCITNVALPRISYNLNNGQKKEAFQLMRKLKRVILLLTIPGVVVLVGASRLFITIIYGTEFIGAVPSLVILSVSVIFSVYNNFWVWQVFIPLSYEKRVFAGTCISALVNFVLNLLWICPYGIAGAATATLAAEMVLTILCMIWGRRCVLSEEYVFQQNNMEN